jgi:hypothetical protein
LKPGSGFGAPTFVVGFGNEGSVVHVGVNAGD